ncbi:dTDP-4-dehydrorhamnose reductase [Alphaproteobacteria bacterium SO-S41]|nr:dTDP-4-dehydrorhamnose reductase [Alphaproteobacteria bacterium SO-S41]
MRLLVTGAEGQVGQALLALPVAGAAKGLGRAELDITDRGAIERAIADFAPTVVINAAAYTAVDAAESDEAGAFAVNAAGAGLLAAAAAEAGAGFVHISTDYVFDGRLSRPYVESDATGPLNAYGRSKRAGELAVLDAHPRASVVRTSWVYAATGRNFVRTMVALARTRERVQVVTDQRGAPTYAGDLAVALLGLAQASARDEDPRVLHLAGSGAASWFEVAAAIFETLRARGLKAPVLEGVSAAAWPSPVQRPQNSMLDCRLASETYGLALPDWRDALRRCLQEILDDKKPMPGLL